MPTVRWRSITQCRCHLQVIDAEQQLHEDSGFLKQQLDALLQVC